MKKHELSTQYSDNHDIWGAEAFLYKEKWFGYNVIKKIRSPKKYRINEIDFELRTTRTITESRLMIAAKKLKVNTPTIFEIDLENTSIVMEDINGISVKEWLNNISDLERQKQFVKLIGEKVGILHTNDIVHGDLTTSNMIKKNEELYFIDFGLGKFSQAIEDKAVDILLMKKCFTSTHTSFEKEFFISFQKGYLSSMQQANSIFKRAAKVESRARHLKENQIINDYLIS